MGGPTCMVYTLSKLFWAKIKFSITEYQPMNNIEQKQKQTRCYPLIDWGITEAKALQYCYDLGFDWGGRKDAPCLLVLPAAKNRCIYQGPSLEGAEMDKKL